MMIGPTPYVLLDDAREGGAAARLYRDPVRIVVAARSGDIAEALADVRRGLTAGLHAAGLAAYDAAQAFGVAALASAAPPLWFGLFEGYQAIPTDRVADLLPDPAGAWTGAPAPLIDRDTYDARLAEVLALIAAGDIYQANLTFSATVAIVGDPLAVYARLRQTARAGYGAIIDTGERRLLSLSPELFFSLDAGRITCRPMKGTAARVPDAQADRTAAATLADDPKQRAENLMIVDLMRNDLARVATAGSVAVPERFTVEQYPTVHQMTSTVTATLAPGRDAIDILAALFPCGSVVGAPKHRAGQVIAEVEPEPRGVYCGAIGHICADGDAMFNVAIRTIDVTPDGSARIGLGSGIVADSSAGDEWRECLAKGAFVDAGQRRFDLLETMRFDPQEGLAFLDRHIARLKASADLFGFRFNRHEARNALQAATFRLRRQSRVRLLLAPSGATSIEVSPMPEPVDRLRVAVVPLPVAGHDFRLRHKTSDRGFYDDARDASGADEVVFVDADGFLTEGSFTSLFVERGGRLVTPPCSRGLLPGVLRAELLATGEAVEGDITETDLAHGFLLGNALRGLVPAALRL